MDGAGDPPDGCRSPAPVRHVGTIAERPNTAPRSPGSPRTARDHRRAALAARSFGRGLSPADKVIFRFLQRSGRSPPSDLGVRLHRFDEPREPNTTSPYASTAPLYPT